MKKVTKKEDPQLWVMFKEGSIASFSAAADLLEERGEDNSEIKKHIDFMHYMKRNLPKYKETTKTFQLNKDCKLLFYCSKRVRRRPVYLIRIENQQGRVSSLEFHKDKISNPTDQYINYLIDRIYEKLELLERYWK